MCFNIKQELLSLYIDSGKNPNYSLTFILNSVDPNICAKGIEIVDHFQLSGDTVSFDIDDNNIHLLNALFGSINATLIEKLLWIAFMFPEI